MYLGLLIFSTFVYYLLFKKRFCNRFGEKKDVLLVSGALFYSLIVNNLVLMIALGNQTIAMLEANITYAFLIKYAVMTLAIAWGTNSVISFFERKVFIENSDEKHSRKKVIVSNIILGVLLICIFGIRYLLEIYEGIPAEQLAFHLQIPIEGTSEDTIENILNGVLRVPVIVLLVLNLQFVSFARRSKNVVYKAKKRKIKVLPIKIYSRRLLALFLVVLIAYGGYAFLNYDIYNFVANQFLESTLIEDEYVNPSDVSVTFPEKKRNLIYIYLESMETVYEEYTPYLYSLVMDEENISFSNDDNYGGFSEIVGANWTIASMVAQTSGLPLKFSVDSSSYNAKSDTFLNGVVSLGDILEDNGYKNYLFMGSNADFAARRTYYELHGNYEIYDYYSAVEEGKISEDYFVWWGYEDKKLYEIAKEKLTRISQNDEPFNFSLITVDTHPTEGYVDETCTCGYEEQYANVLKCADNMVKDFIEWIKQQPFYENSTIVLVGDHLYMESSEFMGAFDQDERYVYNVILNPYKNSVKNQENRLFSAVDMFPTTLAALGAEIAGERLGLGVNMFSGEETILEKYGLDYVNAELKKKSTFYNEMSLYTE